MRLDGLDEAFPRRRRFVPSGIGLSSGRNAAFAKTGGEPWLKTADVS